VSQQRKKNEAENSAEEKSSNVPEAGKKKKALIRVDGIIASVPVAET